MNEDKVSFGLCRNVEMSKGIVPILLVEKLRHREVNDLPSLLSIFLF